MQEIRQIIVPVDFHQHTDTLADFALHVAGTLDAKVTFIHVMKHLPDDIDYTPETRKQLEKSFIVYADKKMAEFVGKMKEKGPGCTGEILQGEVADAIIAYAQEKGADLIVISTHGAQGIQKVLLGSVADRVVKGVHCPILVFNPFKGERGYEVCSPLDSCIQPV
jgi:nucleotide-binding universal stress UspA family protein